MSARFFASPEMNQTIDLFIQTVFLDQKYFSNVCSLFIGLF